MGRAMDALRGTAGSDPGEPSGPGAPPTPAEEALLACQEPGERALWSGHPPQGMGLRRDDPGLWCLLVVLLVWTGGVLFPFARADQEEILYTAALGRAGIAAVPWLLILLKVWAETVQRAGTAYAVTDRRVLLGARSLGLDTITNVELDGRFGGPGSIRFLDFPGSDGDGGTVYPGFVDVPASRRCTPSLWRPRPRRRGRRPCRTLAGASRRPASTRG